MEIVEDRHQNASILITSQRPVVKWHDIIGIRSFVRLLPKKAAVLKRSI